MKQRIVLVILFGLLCNPFFSFGQDSTAVKDLNEEKQLKFQTYFFKALSEKSIKNYQKAIENLEFCFELSPQDPSVHFEFSKNYLLMNQVEEAKQYILKALGKDANNIWMLDHLVQIHKKERDYISAIDVQKKIIAQDDRRQEELIRLYYLNRDFDKALGLMNTLEQGKGLSRNMKSLKRSLEFRKGLSRNMKSLKRSLEFRKGPVITEEKQDLQTLIKNFKENTSFTILQKLLDRLKEEDQPTFHKITEEAIDLFPAQPYVYLMRGRSLEIQGKFQQAMSTLETGIDFVIDNANLEAQFYEIMAKVCDGLGNSSKAQEFRNKAKKLKIIE